MSTYRLEKLFAPQSVAVIGASPRERSVGRAILRNLRAFPGDVHLVNPRYHEIDGVRTVKSYQKLEAAPDLAVVAVPPAMVPDTVAAIAEKGTPGAVIVTAGLGHGAGSLAERCAATARASGLRLVGPNCLGVLGAARRPQCQLHRLESARRRSRFDLAVRRHRRGAGRMGGDARRRLFRRGLDRRCGRRRFRRSPGLLRAGPRDPRHPALRRIDPRRAQIHVGGARRGARQAGDRDQGRPPRPRRQGGGDPHRRAGRFGCGLRRRVPPRRTAARVRSRRTVRRRGNARTARRLFRPAARDPDQWRRHRRARRRPPGRSRRRPRRHFAGDHDQARRRDAADLVARQSDRHRRRRRCRPLQRGDGCAHRRPRQRRRPGHERADRARLVGRRRRSDRRPSSNNTATSARRQNPCWRCGSAAAPPRRRRSMPPASRATRPRPTRSPASCTSCAIATRSMPVDGGAAEPAAGFRAGYAPRRAP